MKKKLVILTMILAVTLMLAISLPATCAGFPYGWFGDYDQLYVVNAIPQLVDSYSVVIKSYDSSGNLLESERYSGDYFTYLVFDVEQPAGFSYATAKIRITLFDETVCVFYL